MPATANDLLLEHQICFPLYAASRLLTRLYQPLLEPLGLTYPQYIVLMILWEDAPCTVSHIGERAQLASNTLTPLLKRLEQSGLVQRERSSDDERVVDLLRRAGHPALWAVNKFDRRSAQDGSFDYYRLHAGRTLQAHGQHAPGSAETQTAARPPAGPSAGRGRLTPGRNAAWPARNPDPG